MRSTTNEGCVRRTALRALAASATLLALHGYARGATSQSGAPACVLTPAQTEGPFFVDERLERSDIRSDPADGTMRQGIPLALTLRIAALADGRCAPLANAIVDVWHCDAEGRYSDAQGMGMHTKGSKFLRGYQITDKGGQVRFTTIYPGAYPGRAVHIHFKVRTQGGRRQEFTSQLYFDDALTDSVHAHRAYAGAISRRMRNAGDGLFRDGGRALALDVVENGEGFAAQYDVGVRVG
ncbi:MAG TPA: intradiol ring-cleavage dioxygenase [Casimicrobiaceae bacterium]|nr:intradiol ring-cleavage dioxygenase [Casimicrobiaceae bacterium]